MQIHLPDPVVQEVVAEILDTTGDADLAKNLLHLSVSAPREICDATVAVASAMLLAKTAMPQEQGKYLETIARQLAPIRRHHALIALALALVEAEASTTDDVFRDRRIITDSLFESRLAEIKQHLRH
ncbi:hypothetical protein HQ619_07610 [Burkholderia gladioli]|jgi:hypothetical protein|uniref:hypothetical protein n=1 Tax=Burkholderia gladioli TaxID=28095 RepID=UPI0015607999|nr:hypothetical protein [Burkholderia gladioli]NRF83793.1 hypothetical protein [Burkholderia gladioli]